MKALLLSQDEVKSVLDMPATIKAVEEAFASFARGKVQMPAKLYLDFKKYSGDLRIMPAYLEEQNMAGAKIVNVHPNNQKKNMPTVMATILLNDPETGVLLSVMDGTYITNLRTGAAGGIAAKYLARKDSKVVGLVGAGSQAQTQLAALRHLFPVAQVKVVSASFERTKAFADKMSVELKIPIEAVKTIEEAAAADIVCTTTPSRQPIVQSRWIKSGTHINAIGADAPGKEELDPEILKRAKVVIDSWAQAPHSGEINVPLAKGLISREMIYGELSEIIAGRKKGRESDSEITVFDSTGLALQDISVAKFVYDRAVKEKIGKYWEPAAERRGS